MRYDLPSYSRAGSEIGLQCVACASDTVCLHVFLFLSHFHRCAPGTYFTNQLLASVLWYQTLFSRKPKSQWLDSYFLLRLWNRRVKIIWECRCLCVGEGKEILTVGKKHKTVCSTCCEGVNAIYSKANTRTCGWSGWLGGVPLLPHYSMCTPPKLPPQLKRTIVSEYGRSGLQSRGYK